MNCGQGEEEVIAHSMLSQPQHCGHAELDDSLLWAAGPCGVFSSNPDPYLLDAGSRCGNQNVSRHYQKSSEEDGQNHPQWTATRLERLGGSTKVRKLLACPRGLKPPRGESTQEKGECVRAGHWYKRWGLGYGVGERVKSH